MKKQFKYFLLLVLKLFFLENDTFATCTGSASFTTTSPACPNATVTFTNTSTGSADSYIWKWGDATANTTVLNTNNQTHTYAIAGTYVVWLVRIFNTPSCRDSISQNVIVNTNPVASFSFAPNNACSLTPVQFLNTSTGTGLTYSWNLGNSTTSTLLSPSVQYAAYGNGGTQTYNVSLVATSSNGCSASSAAQTVTVIKRPNANLAFASNITTSCNSGSTPFNATVLNNSQFTSLATNYSIDWGDGSPILSNNTFVSPVTETHPYTAMGYSNILFTITTSNGCNDTAQYKVFKGSIPSVGLGIQGGTIGCLPQSYTFDVSNVITNTPGTTYNVTVNDNTASVAFTQSTITSTVSHLFNTTSCGTTSGTFTNSFKIEISATNPCGSSAAEVKPIVISEKPVASFSMTPNPRACTNQTVTFTNTSVPPNSAVFTNGNYDCNTNMDVYWAITPSTGWTVSSGSVGITGFVPGSNIVGIQFTQPGNYSITMSASGSAGVCGSDTATRTICITNPIVPAFTVSNNSGCAPLSINTNNTTPQPTCGTNTYSWAVTYSATSLCDNSSAFTFTSGTTASSISPSFQFTNAGTYTITLSVTNVCGTLTTTKTVVVKKKPLATVSPIAGSCLLPYIINPTLTDTNCAANALTYSWTFAGGTPATSTSAAPTNISFASIGNHIVTASVTNECGTTVATTNFTIVPNTPVTVISNPSSICIGASATLTASNASNYSWSPATNLNTTSGATVTASPAITTNYTVTGTSGTCTSNAQVTVTVNPLPAVNISPSSISICAGQNVSLTASGANTYTWLPTTGLSVANAATVAANPTATTLYTVTGISASGCSNTQTINVIVKPLPTVIAGATPQQFCNTNTPVQLAGFSPAGGSWSGTGVTAAGVFTPSVVGVNSTILTYSYTDPGTNCANSATITANVTNPTVANAGSGFSKCINGSAVPLSGFTPLNGTWSGAGVTGNNFNPASAAIGTNILTYSIGSGSCLSTDTIHVIVNPLPAINISPANATLCVGQNVSLTASGANTYSWLPTAGLSVANSASVTATPNATTTYTVTGTSANGCSNSQSVTVTVNPLPTVSAGTSPQQFCNTNTPIQLAGFSPAGGSWSGTGVTTAGVFTPSVVGVNSTILTYSYTDPGTNCTNSATITANVTNPTVANAGNGFSKCINGSAVTLSGFTPAGGTWSGAGVTGNNFNPSSAAIGTNILTYSIGSGSCLSTDTIHVIVNPLPTINISPANATLCVGQNVSLTASGANTYTWLPTTGLSVANAATVAANPTATTLYTVTGISASGCSNTQTINVLVNPLPTVIAGATPQQFCNTNTPVQLAGFSPAGGSWSGIGVTTAGVFTPSVVGVNSTILTYSYTDPGTNCTNSATITANVTNPTVANAGNGFSKCTNASQLALTGFTPAGGTWTGAGVTGNNFNPSSAAIGTNILTYSIGSGSCLSTDTINVFINPLPTVNIAPANATLCVGQNISLTASGANTYSWLPTTGLSVANAATVTANPTATTPYTVTGISASGCSNTQTINVVVNPLPTVIAGATPQQFCNTNTPVQLAGFSPAGGSWSGTGVTATGVFTPSVAGVGLITLTYTFTDVNLCVNSSTIIANVSSPQVANAGNGFSKCINASQVALTGFTPSGGTWTGAGIIGNDFNPAGASIGTNILTYSIGAASCLSTDTVHVIVNTLPTLAVSASQTTICAGDSSNLIVSGANTYSWTPSLNVLNPLNDTIVVNPLTTSNYSVIGTDVNGCINTTNINVSVNQLPIVNAGIDMPFCNTNSTNQLSGFIPLNGIWSGNGIDANGLFNPSIPGNGIWDLVYSFEDSNNCTNTDTIKATVTSPELANAGNGFSICTNASPVTLLGFTPSSGTWTGAGVTGNDFNPASANIGTNILTYSIGAASCLNTDTLNINVVALPVLSLNANPTTICYGLSTSLTATGASTYLWSPTFGLSATTGSNVSGSPTNSSFYFVVGTDVYGCASKDSVFINVNALPTVSAGLDDQFCNQNIPVQLTGFSPSNGIWSGNGINANGNLTPSVAGLGTFNFIYTFTDINGCVNSDTMLATIVNPVQANAGLDTIVCQSNNTITLVGNPNTGFWSGSTSINSNGIFTPNIANTYTVTYTYGIGTCQTLDTKNILVNPLPLVDIGLDISTCETSPIQTLASNIAGGVWSGNGITNVNTGTFSAMNAGVGIDTISYQITSSSTGCINTDSLLINVHPIPTVHFDSLAVSCLNVPINFNNTTAGNNTFYWTFGDGGNSTLANPTHTYNATGTYTIKLIATSQFSCIDSTQRIINVTEPPISNFAQSINSGCGPLQTSFTNNSIAQFSTYNWSFGNGTNSNLFTPSLANYALGILGDSTYYTTLTVTNNCGVSIHQDSIIVLHEPINSLGLNVNSGCSPLTINFTNITTGSANTYTYNFGNGVISNTNQNSFQQVFTANANDTTFYISLIATNICGVDSLLDSVLIHPNIINAAFNTTPTSGCSPLTVNLTNYSTLNCVYNWDLGDGSVYNQYSVNHTYVTFNNNASYIVKLIINNGCSFDTSSVTINVYPQPNLQFALSTDSICSGKSISCFNTSLSLNNTLWNFGDGNTSNLYSPNHNYTSGGQYQVSLIGTSQTNNCIDTAYKYVTVIPTPEINILPTQITGCQPFELPFVNNTQFADFYSWIFGDGNTSANQNPTHTYDSVGTYGGTFIASNFFNCIDSTQFSVLVNAKPKSDFEITHISNCTMPDTLRLINKSIGSVGYNWDFGNGYNSTNNNPTLIYNLPGNYNIRLIAISTKNCSDTLNKLYKASEPPVADFEPTDASKCEPNILFNNLSLFGSDYYWLFADGTTSDEQNPLHNFKTYDSTLVTLIVNKDSQCPDTITKKVIHDNGSHPIVWIPNCFTPNSDDINDVLELKGYDDCDLYRLRIYDRWGVVIFDTTDLTIKWDGKTNGVFTSEGVYSYIFENFSRQIKTVGKIVLLK